jgi:hypothetical protein
MFGENPLKDVDSRVFTRMLQKDGRTEGRTDGSVTISLRNFVGEGIIKEALYWVQLTLVLKILKNVKYTSTNKM